MLAAGKVQTAGLCGGGGSWVGTQVSVLKDFTLTRLGSVLPLIYESHDTLGVR